MQNKRQELLLSILSERRDWLTSRQLAGLLSVSDRTIRSDVEAINRTFDPPPIESNVRSGYRISGEWRPNREKNIGGGVFRKLQEPDASLSSRSCSLT